ncbi:hypothetical protein V6N13_098674 [Hibiscus sabdariffa]
MEAQEKENPNEESTNGVPYGFQRDQPPGTMDQMGRVQVLERPVSPRVLDNPRALKKVVEADSEISEPYGPWMMVDDRRYQTNCSGDGSKGPSKMSGRVEGSRFSVLNRVDDDARIVHERNVHGGGSVPMRVKVVSLVEDGTANVLVHNVGSKMGKHVAVSVMERVLCRNMVRDHKRRFFYLSSIPKRIRVCELRKSHDAMVDDDPVKSHPEVVDNVHDPLHGAKFLMGC